MNVRALLAAATVLGLVACAGENHYEKLADDVTKAVVANDMRPVEGEFNALVRPKLVSRVRVGALSDRLAALGKFEGVKEDTPSGAQAGEHDFAARFVKSTWRVRMVVDADGKIAAYYITPPHEAGTPDAGG